jgi:hypothetical protein
MITNIKFVILLQISKNVFMKLNLNNCKYLFVALSVIVPTSMLAQKKIGDFIESRSNNAEKRGVARTIQYTPKDGGFYTENGTNRFFI